METAVNEKQALMIAVAILGKRKRSIGIWIQRIKRSQGCFTKNARRKNKKKEPKFKPYEQPAQITQAFTEASLAEFEKREIEKK